MNVSFSQRITVAAVYDRRIREKQRTSALIERRYTCRRILKPLLVIVLLFRTAALGESPAATTVSSLPDQTLVQIRFDQKLNAQINPALVFRDEAGRPARLGDYFGHRPVILILGYY